MEKGITETDMHILLSYFKELKFSRTVLNNLAIEFDTTNGNLNDKCKNVLIMAGYEYGCNMGANKVLWIKRSD